LYNYQGPGSANTAINWWPMDSAQRFSDNMSDPNSAQELSQLGWAADSITYKFNSDGYRCDQDFTPDSDSVMFLGCSFTAGMGITNESTWAYQVAQHLGFSCYNLGWPGGSPDTVFRISQYWIPLLKPKQVVCLWPDISRRELFYFQETIKQQVATVDHDDQCYTEWLSDERNYHYQFLRNRLALQYVCVTQNIPLLYYTLGDNLDLIIDHGARDLAHPGIAANAQFAKKVINDLKIS
jgi:hypothetical protein